MNIHKRIQERAKRRKHKTSWEVWFVVREQSHTYAVEDESGRIVRTFSKFREEEARAYCLELNQKYGSQQKLF